MPTVTLYLNGHPIRSTVSRHMVTEIDNVTRDMGQVSCYADNGYGTPMQASRKITISRPPSVSAPMESHAMVGDELVVRCTVDAFPAPTIAVFRDKDLKNSVMHLGRTSLQASADPDEPSKFTMEMKITDLKTHDGGLYYCHANNTLGEAVAVMGVNVTTIPPPVVDVTECCRSRNISADCLDICSFSIDFDMMYSKPQCVSQFHELMHCASDGSDHRHCCQGRGVPGSCINWCRGQPVSDSDVCAISHSQAIVSCFHEGNTHLPGPPTHVIVRLLSSDSAEVMWDVPKKNPENVELYRVFWRPVGAKDTFKNDTVDQQLRLNNLVSGVTYELVVKAGNSNGTSHLTAPLRFITGDEVIIETSARAGSGASEVVGVVFAVLVICALLLLVLYVMKKKNIVLSVKKPSSPTVSFENPFHSSREIQSNNQVITESNVEISSSGSWQGEMSVRGSSDAGVEDPEPAPSLLNNLRIGRPGPGFQRFK